MPPATIRALAGRYDLEERIGTGGYSEVWRCRDRLLGRPVAVKILHGGYAPHAETAARFRAEARHAACLSHPNVARVYDYGEQGPADPPFLVMEYVPGPSLAQVLAGGAIDCVWSMEIVAQAAAGLHAAHQAGLVHRDVKPGNLLLATGGAVKITDFGISHTVGSAPVTRTGLVVGTPGYLAPERVAGARGAAASDLYALGMVGYECLAGAPPFTGSAVEVALAHRERPLPSLPPSVPAEVAALIVALTAKDPAARPGNAGEVAQWATELADLARSGIRPGPLAAAMPNARTQAGARQPTRYLPVGMAPWRRAARRYRLSRGRAVGAAAVAATVAGLVLASMAPPGVPGRPLPVPSSSSVAGPQRSAVLMVDVNGTSLQGQPVSAAVRRLRRQGLVVRMSWQATDTQPYATVVSVLPSGRRPVGSVVTVTASLGPGPTSPPATDGGGPHAAVGGRGRGAGKPHRHGGGHGNGGGAGQGRGGGDSQD